MKLMRSEDALTQEDGFHFLLPNAAFFIDELLEAFGTEEDHGLKCWLLELIGESKSPKSFQVLREYATSADYSLKSWAAEGLKNLGSAEAKAILDSMDMNN